MAIKLGTTDVNFPYTKIMLGDTEVWKAKTGLDFDDLIKYSQQLMNDTSAPAIIRDNAQHFYNARESLKNLFVGKKNFMVSRQNTSQIYMRIGYTDVDFSTKNMNYYNDSIYTGNVYWYYYEIDTRTDTLYGSRSGTSESYFSSYWYGLLGTMTPEQTAKIGSQCYAQNKYLG